MVMVERCYIINLKRRPDRLRAILAKIDATDWPFPKPIIFEAIDGDKVGVPPEFTQGGGAYGCRCSHVAILQKCLMEDVESVLILEDDADIRPWTGAACRSFLQQVPGDWQGIMLGGQHHAPPIPIRPGLVRVRYAQRTHAYIARGVYMKALQKRWGNATVHIDWLMENWQERYIVYAPEKWLIGQCGGRSDIRGEEKPAEWWNEADTTGPLFLIEAPAEVITALRPLGFSDPVNTEPDKLTETLRYLAQVCASGLLPMLANQNLTPQDVQPFWQGPVIQIKAQTYLEALEAIPEAYRPPPVVPRNTLTVTPVVILEASRCVMEQLRLQGFHTGYHRDETTGIDVGLMELAAEGFPPEKLRHWLEMIIAEADRDGLVPTVWYPKAPASLEPTLKEVSKRPVLSLRGHSAGEIFREFVHAAL